MHVGMILIAVTVALLVRVLASRPSGNWSQRWHQTLFLFLFPPLLILMTALAVLWMGFEGEMLGLPASGLGYGFALLVLVWALVMGLKLGYGMYQAQQQLKTCEEANVLGSVARILETEMPYSAQIGFWHPQLVVSQGLLQTLDEEHLEAVLAHEEAHLEYRDTFWFFWLGWLRSLTSVLPQTETLWQELLLLREMRADRMASEVVDELVLAESLLTVAKTPLQCPEGFCAPFSWAMESCRLLERIEALLTPPEGCFESRWWVWSRMILVFLPWATIPLHYS